MSDITIGASEIEGFQPQGIGADIALTGVIVTLNDTAVTGTNFLPQSVVGLSGFKISLGTPAVTYTVASVQSRSALTLTSQYLASSGTVTGTLHKFVVLRVYALTAFTPSGESFVVQPGSPGSTAWFRRYGVSVISDGTQNVAHVPEIVLPATTNSNVPTAQYFGGLYTKGDSGGFIQAYPGCVDQWQLDADTTPTSWAQICDFNTPPPPTPNLSPDDFVTESELNARLPSGTEDQLLYFAATGNVLTPLDLSSDFTIVADELQLSSTSGYDRIQEEGANLPQQNTLNFVGSSFTAADDAGSSRTNVTADSDLNAIASNATNGIYARTGAGTVSARTITGTANRITVTDGDGVAGNPTLDIGSTVATSGNNLSFFSATTSAQLAGVISDETGSGAAVFGTSPALTTPRVVTSINDTNGNEMLKFAVAGSAVNEFTIQNAATGSGPGLSATGDDANIPCTLANKGTGNIVILANSIDRFTVSGSSSELYLGNGVVNASPASFLMLATGGSGTNIAGAHLALTGGKGTGTGIPGQAAVQYPLIGASGTTLQSLSTEQFPISSSIYTNTVAGTAIANTVTETSIFTGATASTGSTLTLQGGIHRAGTVYRLRVYLGFNTTGTPTIQIRLRLGGLAGTILANSGAVASPNNSTGLAFLDLFIHINTTGATAAVRGQMEGRLVAAVAGAVTPVFFVGDVGPAVVDLTANQAIDITAQWGTASASNIIQLVHAVIDRMR